MQILEASPWTRTAQDRQFKLTDPRAKATGRIAARTKWMFERRE
jgi:hypothetical protein